MDGGPVHPNAPWQALEVAGKDYGESDSGFGANFALKSLTITGDKTYVYLQDAINNGDRGAADAPEVLYIANLTVAPGATLNLNGIDLYVDIPGYSPQGVMPSTKAYHGHTQLLNADAALVTIQDLLGHTRIKTTQRYCRVSNTKVQRDYHRAMVVVMERTSEKEA
jgi:hypothetical protein